MKIFEEISLVFCLEFLKANEGEIKIFNLMCLVWKIQLKWWPFYTHSAFYIRKTLWSGHANSACCFGLCTLRQRCSSVLLLLGDNKNFVILFVIQTCLNRTSDVFAYSFVWFRIHFTPVVPMNMVHCCNSLCSNNPGLARERKL